MEHDDGTTTGACPRSSDQLRLDAAGGFVSVGATATTTMVPSMPACNSLDLPDGWGPSPCYGEVSTVVTGSCGYIDLRDGRFKTGSCSSVLYRTPTTFTFSMESDRWDHPTVYPPPRPNCTAAPAFGVYYNGGDARYPNMRWSGRGPASLGCRITFEGPSPDGLYGPTWVLVRSSARINTAGSTLGATASAEAFVPIDGDMRDFGPIARFSASEMADDGEVTFTNESFHPTDEPMTFTWDFGDGTTSTASADEVSHTYTEPGDQTVTLTAKAGSLEHSTSRTVAITGPSLEVSVFFPDGESQKAAGEPFAVEVWVSALEDGVGSLSEVTLGDTPLQFPVEVLTIAESPPDATSVFELDRGDRRSFTWLLQPVSAGRVQISATATAVDGGGRELTDRGEANGSVAGLDVEVEVRYARPPEGSDAEVGPPAFQADNNGDGVIDAADHRVEVVVTATNRTPETLPGVGPIADGDRVVRFSNQLLGDGQVSLQPIEEPHELSFGDLEPDVPVERTYVYEAFGQVRAEARAMLEGVPESGGVVRGIGTADVQLSSDLAVEVEIGLEQRAHTSGDNVRLSGAVRNLLADVVDDSGAVVEEAPDIAVVISPIVDGNAGNGHISVAGGSSMTPMAEEPILLAPEEEVGVSAILLTQRTEQPSEAGVRYLVRAWELTDDGEPAVEIDASRLVVSEQGDFSAEHATQLGAYDFTPDDVRECVTVVVDDIVSCNLYVGIRNLALGLWDLAQLVPVGLGEISDATSRTTMWKLHMDANAIRAVVGDPVAQQAILTEIEVQLETFRELGIVTGDASMSAVDAFVEFLDEAERVVESGDGEAMLAFFSQQAGENIDLSIGGLTKLRALTIIQRSNADAAARTAAATATREARERAARQAQDSIEQRVRDSRARGNDPAVDGTFRGNEDVTGLDSVTRGVYGTDTRTLDNITSIAQSENVLIGWRSRSPIVAELYRLGQIYLKPMDIKAKTVNVIDVHYFGYRRSSMGRVELTEPPIDYRLAAPGNELAFRQAVDDHMATLRSRHPEIAGDALWEAEVRTRLEMRTREYPKQLREFQRYHYEGIRLEFGYDQQGLPSTHTSEVVELRNARVKSVISQGDDGVVRRYLELEMDGPGNNGAFRPIGGDTDVVVLQNPDRTPLTDPDKRRRIYEALQEQIGMQHGETMTYINAEVQAKLLRDHVAGRPGAEALLIAGPDGRVRTGYLEERFSSQLGPDGEPIGSTFNLVSGAPGELLSSATVGSPVQFAGYIQRLDEHLSKLAFYLPGRLANLAAGLTPDQLFPAFDLDGLLLQPDGQGGIVVYDPDATQPPATGPTSPPSDDDPVGTLLDELVAEAAETGLLPEGPPEVGTSDGAWVPISVEDALEAGDGQIVLAPMTSLTANVQAGDTYLPTHTADGMGMASNGDWFEPGDVIVLDPGGPAQEVVTVDALGSLVLTAPVTNDHDAGTSILRLASTADSGAPGNGAAGPGGGDEAEDGVTASPTVDRAALPARVRSLCPIEVSPQLPFRDLAGAGTHDPAIVCAADRGLVRGFPDGTYRSSAPMTRGQVATVLAGVAEAAGGELPAPRGAFVDTPGTSHEDGIERLAAAGVVRGVGDGRFAPNEPVSRAQFVAMLVAVHGLLSDDPLPPDSAHGFGDVTGSAHSAAIAAAAAAGLTNGVRPGRFDPSGAVTRGQAATFAIRLLALVHEPA